MTSKTSLFVSLCLIAALAGCGDDDDTPAGGASGRAGAGSAGRSGQGGSSGAGGGPVGGAGGQGNEAGAGGQGGFGGNASGGSGAGGGQAGAGGGVGGNAGSVGAFDPTFGEGGPVSFAQFPSVGLVLALGLGAEGAIYLGVADTVGFQPGVVSVLADGAVDTKFGQGGIATFGDLTAFIGNTLAVQPDGKPVVAGYDLSAADPRPAFARLSADGTPDASFGNGGFSVVELPGAEGRITALAAQGSRLYAVGTGNDGPAFAVKALSLALQPDGALDPSFYWPVGFHFYVPDPAPPLVSEYVYGLYARPGNGFVACGSALNPDFDGREGDFDFFAVRYLPDGTPDPGFGNDGWAQFDYVGHDGDVPLPYDVCAAVAETPEGKTVFVGGASNAPAARGNAVVARLLLDGSPDPSFGVGGFFEFNVAEVEALTDLVLLPDGSALVAGYGGPAEQAKPLLALVRPNGTLAPEFGADGVLTLDVLNAGTAPVRLARQADGKILVSGTAPTPFLARLNAP